jgi:hypothetical protein
MADDLPIPAPCSFWQALIDIKARKMPAQFGHVRYSLALGNREPNAHELFVHPPLWKVNVLDRLENETNQ